MWSTKPSQFDWRQCKQISGFVLEERKKHQQIELLSFVSVLMVSTKAFTKEKSLFCFCHFSPFGIASNQIDLVLWAVV